MKPCESCGNEYDRAFEVVVAGRPYTFDSFECAINILAPRCATCGVAVVGHGVEVESIVYCCAHCAREAGSRAVRDRA